MSNFHDFARNVGAIQVHKCVQNKQTIKKVVVLDFEATCWSPNELKKPNEIIEFSAVLLDISTGNINDKIQIYIQPTENPILSEFCIKLTGITQNKVDGACTINEALEKFNTWIDSNYLDFYNGSCIFATWSNWDLGTCLKDECQRKNIHRKSYFSSWMDVRKLYARLYDNFPKGLMGALEDQGMQFIGKPHCGLDDAYNTALLIKKMYNDGVLLKITKTVR